MSASLDILSTIGPAELAWLALGYLAGSIPFGLLLAKAAGLGDVRRIGSGNIGATNVLRTGARWVAALTLACDMLKGLLPVLMARWVAGEAAAQLAALGAFAGHVFPVWLGFRGGKGVATFIGVLLGLAWPLGLVFVVVWLLAAAAFRISSLSALLAAATQVPALFLLGYDSMKFVIISLVISIFLTHRSNIARLISGSEPRIGDSGKGQR